ncbi:MAG: hypothetical protein ACLFTK_04825 [Anaerolineales bacterium]
MDVLTTVFLFALFGVIGFGALLYAGLTRLSAQATAQALHTVRHEALLETRYGANFFGQQSVGVVAIRGNGTLLLTNERLYFLMWFPRKEISISLAQITGVEAPRSFLGKSKALPLLQVNFLNEAGEADAAAWLIKDRETFQAALLAA